MAPFVFPNVRATTSTYVVNVLYAWDEEFANTAIYYYGYDPQWLALIFLYDVHNYFYETFDIYFNAMFYASWDSDDSITEGGALLTEAETELGFVSGMKIYGIPVDVLIAFTDQSIDLYGCANSTRGVALVCETYFDIWIGQATDNVLQHELSHFYNASHHHMDGYWCVMNMYPYRAGIYEVPWFLVTNSWCTYCASVINSNRTCWGRIGEVPSGGGGGGDPWFGWANPEGGGNGTVV